MYSSKCFITVVPQSPPGQSLVTAPSSNTTTIPTTTITAPIAATTVPAAVDTSGGESQGHRQTLNVWEFIYKIWQMGPKYYSIAVSFPYSDFHIISKGSGDI